MNSDSIVGIVIVHFGDDAPTRRCLASIASDPSPVERRVVVADNSGTLQEIPRWASLLKNPRNVGYGAAVNRGIAALESDEVAAYVVLNNDVEIAPGYLSAAVRACRGQWRDIGAVAGPLYLDPERTTLWYAGGGINFLTGTVRQSTSAGDAQRRRPVGFIPGAAFALNPRAWEQVGGFDPSYFLFSEDVDLCLRLRRAGWRLLFEPEMAAVHELGGSTDSASRSALYLYYTARNRLRPFRPFIYRLYLAVLHSGYVLTRAGVIASAEPLQGRVKARALLMGHWEALKDLKRGPHNPSVPCRPYPESGPGAASR